ncbi:MAG TPA: hypothetical protein VKR32_19065 [Puia sp.]|nr:hypothetical protein [Puia sp.]
MIISTVEEIFKPFYNQTIGRGSGLGHLLSHIRLKVHGREVKVDTGESKSRAFTLGLPKKAISSDTLHSRV